MFASHRNTAPALPIDATELLEEADATIRRVEVNKAYQRIARGLPRTVRLNALLVAGDVFADLESVGVAPGDMAVSLHCRVFGPKRLTQLIGQASRMGLA